MPVCVLFYETIEYDYYSSEKSLKSVTLTSNFDSREGEYDQCP